MWESRSDFQGLWEAIGKPGFGFPRFPWPVISIASAGFLMRYASFANWRRAVAWLSASRLRPPYPIALLRIRQVDRQSSQREEIQPRPATAAESTRVWHTSDKPASACPWP
jgi:hypothetical protein